MRLSRIPAIELQQDDVHIPQTILLVDIKQKLALSGIRTRVLWLRTITINPSNKIVVISYHQEVPSIHNHNDASLSTI